MPALATETKRQESERSERSGVDFGKYQREEFGETQVFTESAECNGGLLCNGESRPVFCQSKGPEEKENSYLFYRPTKDF